MEKEEKVVVEENKNNEIEKNESVVVNSADDETLAPTDDIIPAPEDNGDSDIDTAPEITSVDPPVDPVVVDTPVETPEVPVVDTPVVDTPVNEPVLDAPLADIAPPMQDIPVDAPVTSDVVPESGDENPADVTVCDNPGCDGGCCDNTDVAVPGENTITEPTSITIGQYFGTLQECVTIAWRYHLKTRKHHIHVTLNEFYEKALDVVDDIIEQYQGICGVVEEPFINCIVGDGKTEGEYLTELKAFVENNKSILGCHSEIDSTIDEFLSLIDSTNYKLTAFVENVVKSFDEFVYEDYPAIKESCRYDRYGERSSDDPDDPDYDPNFDGESGEEEE